MRVICLLLSLSSLLVGVSADNDNILEETGGWSLRSLIVPSLLAIFIALWIMKGRKSEPANMPPTISGPIPFLRAGPVYFQDPEGLMLRSAKEHGDCFSLSLLGQRMTIMTGNDGPEWFFNGKEDVISACEAYRFTVPLFGKDVVYDVHPDILTEQKRMIKHSFTKQRFESYIPMIQQEVNDYFDKTWGDSGEGDLLAAFNQVTVFTSVRALHGWEVRSRLDESFAHLYEDLDAALTPLGFFFPNGKHVFLTPAPLPGTFRRDSARKEVDRLFREIIDERLRMKEMPDDIMTSLLNANYKDGRKQEPYEVIGLLIALLLAGQHTSNVTGAWTGIHLLHDKEYLQRVLQEQADVLMGEKPDLHKINSMPALENAIRETLRLRPPLVMLQRKVLQDTEFKGLHINKGSYVAVSPLLNHRLPTMWDNPDKFDPDRFDRKEDKAFRYNYFPFGSGRHQCSGQKFAYLQIKTIWTTLLNKYELEILGDMPKPNYGTVIAGPIGPVNVRYRKRQVPLHESLNK